MKIIPPQPSDLIEIAYLQRVCFNEMKSKGWISYPLFKEISPDDLKHTFILKFNNLTLGMITMNDSAKEKGNVDHHCNGKHLSSSNPLYIDNLTIHPNWWGKNVARELIEFAEEYARDHGFTSVQLNAYAENKLAIKLFEQLRFEQTGEFFSQIQTVPFYCYEKKL